MEKNENNNSAYHFSVKVLVLSALFLVINVAYYGVALLGLESTPQPVTPQIVFAESQDVEVKSPYSDDFSIARSGDPIIAGSTVKTGPSTFAEIELGGNVLRLDENTTVELEENLVTRLDFELKQGSVWVNAVDTVEISTPQSDALFAGAIGSYSYNAPLNRIMAVRGYVDLDLKNEDSELLTEFVIPFKSQVTYADTQLSKEYERLEYSKLKKELKLAGLPQTVLSDEWVKQNTRNDEERFIANADYLFTANAFSIRERVFGLRAKLTLVPAKRRELNLARIDTRLKYLLGAVHENRDTALATTLIDEIKELAAGFENDPALDLLYARQFNVIFNVTEDTPAYMTKEFLRDALFNREQPEHLRSYFADIDFHLRTSQAEAASSIIEAWQTAWNKGLLANSFDEYLLQVRLLESIMFAHADVLDSALLAHYDGATQVILDTLAGNQEAFLAVTQGRLNMAKQLLAQFLYPETKSYLKTSYESLNIEELSDRVAAKTIFLEEAKLIAQRIEFAEESLRGAALPIDETDFRTFISTKTRDEMLSSNLSEFLDIGEVDEAPAQFMPTLEEVATRFIASRIAVQESNITESSSNAFEFEIENARLIDRGSDGRAIVFDAMYDFATNGLTDIYIEDKPFAGAYTLDDFVAAVLSREETVATSTQDADISFLLEEGNEQTQRAQVVAQDLAKQLIVKELEQYNILVPGNNSIDVLDPATLTKFKILESQVLDPSSDDSVTVSFEYDLNTKLASSISLVGQTATVPGIYSASVLPSTVFNAIALNALQQQGFGQAIQDLENNFIQVTEDDLSFAGSGVDVVTIASAEFTPLALEFSGTYNLKTKTFATVTSDLLSQANVKAEDYFTAIAPLRVEQFLSGNGVSVPLELIELEYPYNTIPVRNYIAKSQAYDFEIDIPGNRLENIQIQGTDAFSEVMTFDEFKIIVGEQDNNSSLIPESLDITEATVLDCVDDIDCFAAEASKCAPVKAKIVTQSTSGEEFITYATYNVEVLSKTTEGCLVSLETLDNGAEYTDSYRQQLVDDGFTDDEIATGEEQASSIYKDLIGLVQECTYVSGEAVADLFKRSTVGDTSFEDVDLRIGCETIES